MSIYGRFTGAGPSGFGYSSTAEEVSVGLDLTGQAFLVTGAASGLGLETVRVLAKRGASVFALARTREKAAEATRDYGASITPIACDLAEPGSVREAVQRVREAGQPLHAIIANAGIMALPKRRVAHGIELQFMTNHVGHFMLVMGMLDLLTEEARVVVLSSDAHRNTYSGGIRFDDLDAAKEYSPWRAYGQSKLANLLFARELAARLPRPTQRANAVHPGVIATNLSRHMSPLVTALFRTVGPIVATKSVPQGAATQVYVAVHPQAGKHNGEYFASCNIATPSEYGRDRALGLKLWEVTERLVARL